MSGPGAAPVLSAAPPTVDAALTAAAAQYGDVLAFVDGDRRVTYAEWDRAAAGTARALADAGARAGAVVCLMLPSSVDFAVAFAAAARLGAVVTAVEPAARAGRDGGHPRPVRSCRPGRRRPALGRLHAHGDDPLERRPTWRRPPTVAPFRPPWKAAALTTRR